jgi:FkbM family methyltransferase
VYAFEPSAREYGRLLDNLALNKVENVTPVRAAVSSSSGRATLRVAAASHAGLNTVGNRFAYDGVDTAAIEDVTATTLDESIAGNAVGRVSVIKLDVEGAEGEALKGAIRLLEEHRPALVLEIVPRALDANGWDVPSLEQLLRDARYRLFSIHHETAMLEPIASFGESHEQNVAALPEETVFTGSECPATRGEAYTGRA